MENIKNIDKLIESLNELPDTKVTSWCCGTNYINYFNLFFNCSSMYSMGVLSRVLSRNYLNTSNKWFISLDNHDMEQNPQFGFNLHMVSEPHDKLSVEGDIDNIIKGLEHWSSPTFYSYFKHE